MGKIIFSGGKTFAWDLNGREAERMGWEEFAERSREEIPLFSLQRKKKLLRDVVPRIGKEYAHCGLCPRRCRVNRFESSGYCSVGNDATSFGQCILVSEERLFSPTYALFFQGCNLDCVFCHAQPECSSPKHRRRYDPKEAAFEINRAFSDIRTVSFIGGNPDNSIRSALETVLLLEREIPLVWFGNLYVQKRVIDFLAGVIEAYVVDLKAYRNCSQAVCGAKDYFDVVTENLKHLVRTQPEALVIVRHLVLPGHRSCCLEPLLSWVKDNLKKVRFRLMTGYHPWHRALETDGLKEALHDDEIGEAFRLLKTFGLERTV